MGRNQGSGEQSPDRLFHVDHVAFQIVEPFTKGFLYLSFEVLPATFRLKKMLRRLRDESPAEVL